MLYSDQKLLGLKRKAKSNEEWQGTTKNRLTLMRIWNIGRGALTKAGETSEERQRSLVPFRSMQRPRARRTERFAAVAELNVVEESREEEDEKERGENEKRQFDPIYKVKVNRWARKTRRPKHGYPAARAPRFSGRPLKIRIC